MPSPIDREAFLASLAGKRLLKTHEGAEPPRVVSVCPHCGRPIEVVPAVDGSTVVVDAEVRDFVIDYPSGYVRLKKGRLVHQCDATGDKGHVIR